MHNKILEDSEQWRSSGLENRTVAAMWRQFDSVIFLQIYASVAEMVNAAVCKTVPFGDIGSSPIWRTNSDASKV